MRCAALVREEINREKHAEELKPKREKRITAVAWAGLRETAAHERARGMNRLILNGASVSSHSSYGD